MRADYKPSTHMIRPGTVISYCGRNMTTAERGLFTEYRQYVNCRNCLRGMAKSNRPGPSLQELKDDLDSKFEKAAAVRREIVRLGKMMPSLWKSFRRAQKSYDIKKGRPSVYPSILSKTP